MKKLLLAATLAAALPVLAAPETYTIDGRHTFPTFEVSHFGISTQRGMFTKVAGKITVDRAAKSGSVDVTIDTGSVVTGIQGLTDHLKAEDFFNVARFPTATFKGDKMSFEGDRPVAVDGSLTLNGVSRPVTLTIAAASCRDHPANKKPMCGADATATIKRSDFGIKYALPAVGDEVKLSIPVEAFKD
jgi:polyisoprenoid-binding protein YceI